MVLFESQSKILLYIAGGTPWNYPVINMDADKEIWVLSLYQCHLGHKATEAANNICNAMAEDVLSICMVQHGYNHFESCNFKLDDLPRSSRPLELDVDLLSQIIEKDPRLFLRCLAEQFGCFYTPVGKHRNRSGKT